MKRILGPPGASSGVIPLLWHTGLEAILPVLFDSETMCQHSHIESIVKSLGTKVSCGVFVGFMF